MALIKWFEGEVCALRTGDVVFCYEGDQEYPLHVGLHVGAPVNFSRLWDRFLRLIRKLTKQAPSPIEIQVMGLPMNSGVYPLGVATWGAVGQYKADLFGQRLDVDPVLVKMTVLFADRHSSELSLLGAHCLWSRKGARFDTQRQIAGKAIFIKGNCAQYVEYIYDLAGLDLVDERVTCDPAKPLWLDPATQAQAFWAGTYPLACPWHPKLGRFDGELIGARTLRR